MYELVTIPCLSDNYAFLFRHKGKTALIDVPEATPILGELRTRGWGLDEIWITHHHHDHIDGVEELRLETGALVRGATADQHRLPDLDVAHKDGDRFQFGDLDVDVLDVSGHTIGHIAFNVPEAKVAFTADSLMACGCGRLFEGTAEQMWGSLNRMMAWPSETVVCSGHEYTTKNAEFALTIDPENAKLKARMDDIIAARARGIATVPSTLELELETNPFLRAGLQSVKDALNMSNDSDVAVFAEIRRRRDSF